MYGPAWCRIAFLMLLTFGCLPRCWAQEQPRASVAGTTSLVDPEHRFIKSHYVLLHKSTRLSRGLVGQFIALPTEQIFLFNDLTLSAGMITFHESGLSTIFQWVALPMTPGSIKEPVAGAFFRPFDGLAGRLDDGRLFSARLSANHPPRPAPWEQPLFLPYPPGEFLFTLSDGPGVPFRISGVGDIDGNEFDDLLLELSPSSGVAVAFSNGSGGFSVEHYKLPCRALAAAGPFVLLADVDDDRPEEVVCRSAEGQVYAIDPVSDGNSEAITLFQEDKRTKSLHPLRLSGSAAVAFVASFDGRIQVWIRRGEEGYSLAQEIVLPAEFRTDEIYSGDVVGDSDQELLLRDRIAGRWLVYAAKRSRDLHLISDVQEPFFSDIPAAKLGRFREKHKDSILLFSPASMQWAVSNFANPVRLGGVRLAVDTGEVLLSDARGWFSFPELASGIRKIQASFVGVAFKPDMQTIDVRPGERLQIDFIATLPPPDKRPDSNVCVGFNRDSLQWGMVHGRKEESLKCARGGAAFATQDGEDLFLPDCCPLPSDDILTKREVFAEEQCPDGYVVQGPYFSSATPAARSGMLVCREVNQERYQLAPARPGQYWGIGLSHRGESRAITRREMPLALRFGIGRTSARKFDNDGCIGDPVGSLLVTRNYDPCSKMRFRQLLYKGLPGDPPAGTPVQMFPDCLSISSPFEPFPSCTTAR